MDGYWVEIPADAGLPAGALSYKGAWASGNAIAPGDVYVHTGLAWLARTSAAAGDAQQPHLDSVDHWLPMGLPAYGSAGAAAGPTSQLIRHRFEVTGRQNVVMRLSDILNEYETRIKALEAALAAG